MNTKKMMPLWGLLALLLLSLQSQAQTQKQFKSGSGSLLISKSAMAKQSSDGRRAATTDYYGIITAPDEGVHKFYTRTGGAVHQSLFDLYSTVQSGHVEIVECADGTVYIKDILSLFSYEMGTWVKGRKTGNTITIPAGQVIAYDSDYYTTKSLWWGHSASWPFFIREEGDITFTIDGNTISLVGSDKDRCIGLYWDEDTFFAYYADYETVWTLDEDYVVPSAELVQLPKDIEAEAWYADGSNSDGENTGVVPTNVKVAFDGNNIYVSGIFSQFRDAWIKGTLEGTTVSFPTPQYIGADDGKDMWTFATKVSDGTILPAVTFTYNADAKTLTLDKDQILAANGRYDRLYYLEYIDELIISAEPQPAPVAPYTADFTKSGTIRKFNIVDANNDGATWMWNEESYAHYPFHKTNPADDYLILPIKLDANKNYNVVVRAAAALFYDEKFEVKVGKGETPDELNTTVIPETTLTTYDFIDYEGSFMTDETAGIWYVAVHAISDPDQLRLMVQSLSVEAGVEPTAPAAVTDLTATAGEKGALEVNLTFTAPDKAINGTPLTGTENIKIYRDGDFATLLEGVAVGTPQTWKDTNVEDGKTYTYHVVAVNETGDGEKSEKVSVYVGQDAPSYVENVQVTATTDNTITFTWDPVKGAHGGYIDAQNVVYEVYHLTTEYDWWSGDYYLVEDVVLSTVTGKTTATIEYEVDKGEQHDEWFGVKAIVGRNESNATWEPVYVNVGAPYELPFEVTDFADADDYLLLYWDWNAGLGISPDGSDDNSALAVHDGGIGPVLAFLETGKLDLSSAAKPVLTFDAMKGVSTVDKMTVYGIMSDGTATDIKTITLTDQYQTYEVEIPASLKDPRWSRLGFKVDLKTGEYILLDNIRVVDATTGLSVTTIADKSFDVYSLDGKLVRRQTATLDGLKGVYVVNGKKVMLK